MATACGYCCHFSAQLSRAMRTNWGRPGLIALLYMSTMIAGDVVSSPNRLLTGHHLPKRATQARTHDQAITWLLTLHLQSWQQVPWRKQNNKCVHLICRHRGKVEVIWALLICSNLAGCFLNRLGPQRDPAHPLSNPVGLAFAYIIIQGAHPR